MQLHTSTTNIKSGLYPLGETKTLVKCDFVVSMKFRVPGEGVDNEIAYMQVHMRSPSYSTSDRIPHPSYGCCTEFQKLNSSVSRSIVHGPCNALAESDRGCRVEGGAGCLLTSCELISTVPGSFCRVTSSDLA